MYGFKEITPAELQEMQSGGNLRLIDVRSDAEVARGMTPKASEWGNATLTVFYCQSGARSAQACTFFAGKGFSKLYHLQGGVNAWVKSGLPLTGAAAK